MPTADNPLLAPIADALPPVELVVILDAEFGGVDGELPHLLAALGILESFSVASLIEGADAAVKAANVQLIEIRLAMALGGKAFVTLTGNVAAVESAIDAGAQVVGQKGMLVNKVVIPSPRPELLNEMI